MPEKQEAEIKEAKAQAKRGEPRNEAPVTDKESASEAKERRQAETVEATYSRDRLIADARAHGATPPEVAGALALKSNKQNFSHEELQELLDEFRNREVEMS